MRVWGLATALLCGGVGCAHDEATRPPSEASLPGVFAVEPGSQAGAVDVSRWWRSFGDPQLDALVEQALEGNLDMVQSWARLEQFARLAEQQGSVQWPQISADLSASRRRAVGFDGAPAHANAFAINGAASYEVDLWGRLEALDDAAQIDAMASREDLEALAMTVAAQVADTWFGVVEQRAQLDLLDAQIKTNAQFLELTELRFAQGQTSALDVYQQRQQVLATRAQRPLIQSRLSAQEHQLAVLLGVPAGALKTADRRTLPETSASPAAGLPSELLKRRPDLRSAQARAASQDRRVAAAIADRYPSIRLTATTGLQADNLGDLIDQWVWSVASSLAMPLLDGGRRAAEVERQKAALDERVGFLLKATLQAFREVQDALVAERHQREFLALNAEQLEVARVTLDEARRRYVQGLTDYLPVLSTLQRVQQIEQSQLGARRQIVSLRIQLHRALGGDWTAELSAPARAQEESSP